MTSFRPALVSSPLAASAVLFTSVSAQVVPPPKPGSAKSVTEPAIELSPFVISSSSETGWVATETLAGSRLRTNFKDVPNQIETLTKDFMDDLGVTNMDQALSDAASEGCELELNITPVRNWNIRLNGAKSEAIESNIGKEWFEWGAMRLPVWESVVAKNGEVDAQGRPVTWTTAPYNINQPSGQTLAQYYQANVVGRVYAFISAADGRATDTARNARTNLITNYSFTGERLKGFNIGGLNYRVQVNVRNALNEDDPLPIQTGTTDEVVKLATIDPRTWVFTFAVNF